MSTTPRTRRLHVVACVGLSLVLVVGAFDPSPHTGGDNAGYVSLAYSLLTTGSYVDIYDPAGAPHVKYPPVFPVLLAGLIALGARTWIALKSVAALSTLALVGLTYLWAERRLGMWPAFAVAVLVAVSTGFVYYSHWILSDALFVAFAMAALWALERSEDSSAGRGWLGAGLVAAALAYLTRSAGLPLVVATLAWLALARRWRALGAATVVLGVPALLWWLRGLGATTSYASEFWMVDPYDPSLGNVGLLDLPGRALDNLATYVLTWIPFGIVGRTGWWVGALGVALTLATAYGWIRAVRDRVGLTELFVPLYAVLILFWPQVWAGDRFALPLYPMVLLYGSMALLDVIVRVPRPAGRAIAAVVFGVLLVPSLVSWVGEARWARACAAAVRAGGAFACVGPRVGAFVSAAEWTGHALPEDAVVMTRKPRHFYVLSAVPSRTFPFDADPDVQLAAAEEAGARYVLLDEWDGLATRYVGGAVRARPEAFCFVSAFGHPDLALAQLLGILPREARVNEGAAGGDGEIVECPPDYVRGAAPPTYSASSPSSSTAIPLLEGLDP